MLSAARPCVKHGVNARSQHAAKLPRIRVVTRSQLKVSSSTNQTEAIPPFHLAFPVRDVEEARQFYTDVLGCSEGRSADTWVDLNMYGHQVVAHLVRGYNASNSANAVDGDAVPVPHFGVALTVQQFHDLAAKLKARPGFKFVIEPHLRFQGKPGEQWTMFFHDPSNNAIEFKAMTNPANLFAKYRVE